MSDTRLLTIKELSEATAMPLRTIRSLKRKRKIPYLLISARMLRFDLSKVREALNKFEVGVVE